MLPINAQTLSATTATLEPLTLAEGSVSTQEREDILPETLPERQSAGDFEADAAIIGGGPGGYVAALRVAQLGGKAILIERDNVGGTCLNWGCIPSKALLASAELFHQMQNSTRFGVKAENVTLDLEAVMKHKDQVVSQLRQGTEFLLKKAKVEYLRDTGRLMKDHSVVVGDRRIRARNVILSMGSVVSRPPIPGLGDNYITSNEALSLNPLPKNVCIIGAGAVGLEMGYFWHACGSEVTIVEMLPHVGTGLDEEVSNELRRALENDGIRIHTQAKAREVRDAKEGREVVCDTEKGEIVVTADTILVATGRWPATRDQGLEDLGIAMEQRGFITVNERMETSLPNVYAIGDIVGGAMLAHKGSHEGMVAAENLMGGNRRMDYRAIPIPIYTNPEVASVGMTEAEAREAGHDVRIGKFPYRILGKSLAIGNRTGFAKLVADRKYGEILGAHLIGPHATDMIAEMGVAIQSEATIEEVANTIHPHPSLSEAVMEAALDILGESVHKA